MYRRLNQMYRQLAGLLTVIGAGIISLQCSSFDVDELTSAKSQQQVLSPDQARILGFENPLVDWNASNSSVLTMSQDASDGEHALGIQPAGYTEVSSVFVQAPGMSFDKMSVDVRLPQSVSWGTLGMRLTSPESAVYYSDFGTIDLTSLSPGDYQKVVFTVPPAALPALVGNAEDLVFSIVLNHAPVGAPVLLDNLAFGIPETPFHYENRQLTLSIPNGVELNELFIAASGGLLFDDGTAIGTAGNLPVVSNLGTAKTELGADVNLFSHLKSRSNVDFLRSNSHVFGDVTTSGRVLRQNNVTIDGVATEYVPMAIQEKSWTVEWPVGSGEVVEVLPGTQYSLEPGAYGNVKAFAQTTLAFSSGSYFMESLKVEPGVNVDLDTSNGPILLYVEDEVRLMSPFRGQADSLLIAYVGTTDVELGDAFRGTVVAPSAVINLRRPPSENAHQGSFFGSQVHAFSDCSVEFVPFDFSFVCTSNASCLTGVHQSPTKLVNLQLVFPYGTDLSLVTMGAKQELTVVNGSLGKDQGLLTVAEGTASVTGATVLGSLVATNGGTLGSGSTVQGDLLSEVPFTKDSSASVQGNETSGVPLSPAITIPVSARFPAPTQGDVFISQGDKKILSPGRYGALSISEGGEVYLQAGFYQFSTLHLSPNADLTLASVEGTVKVEVSGTLFLKGNVGVLGNGNVQLSLLYAGQSDVDIGGSFKGSLLAPRATLAVDGGDHDAFFYGEKLQLSGGANVTYSDTRVPEVVREDPEVFVDIVSDQTGGVLVAESDRPGVYTDVGGFSFPVPSELPVAFGNAGNASAELTITRTDSSQLVCSYQGGAGVGHPTSLLDIAKGLKYVFSGCSDGTLAGAVVDATEVALSLSGDENASVPRTGINLGFGDTCNHDLEQPIDPVTSRQMIEAFSWSNASHVPVRNASGEVALYYANIYFENPEDISKAQRLLIHYQSLPLFSQELSKYSGKCGSVDLSGDGEGIFVFAVLPGAIYNKLIDALNESDIPTEEREVFRAVILRTPPPGTADENGALLNEGLRVSGFRYLDLNELPADEALEELIYGDKVTSSILNAIEWIGEATKDFVREVVVALGTVDKWSNGSHQVTIDLDVPNLDLEDRFANDLIIQSGWDTSGSEVAPDGIQATLYTLSTHWNTLWVPVPTASKGRLDDGKGGVTLDVPNAASGQVDFVGLCYEMVNDAARITPFLTNAITCDFRLSNDDFNDFSNEDITIRRGLKNKNLVAMSELTDSASYLYNVVGLAPVRVNVLTGPWASIMSPSGLAWVSCLGMDSGEFPGNLAAEAIFAAATSLSGLAGNALRVLAENDMYLPSNDSNFSRGVPTHEYGHFALCQLSKSKSNKVLESTTKTLDALPTIGAGPEADDESRLFNEAFADFYLYQVAGGVNYFNLWSDNNSVFTGYVDFNYSDPGLEKNDTIANWTAWHSTHPTAVSAEASARINWYASILQDLFDGSDSRTLEPTNGDHWGLNLANKLVPDSTRSTWFDRENVVLPGGDLLTFAEELFDAVPASGAYRYDAVDEAIVRTLERGNVDWCNKCLLLADNYASFALPGDIKSRMVACLSGDLADKVGAPPIQIEQLNALTCQPCPPGQGMGISGECTECGADVVVDWASFDGCDDTIYFDESSSVTDICPDDFVVDIQNIQGTDGIRSVGVGPANGPTDSNQCNSTGYSIAVQAGAMSTSLPPGSAQAGTGIPSPPCNGPLCNSSATCSYPGLTGIDVVGAYRVRIGARTTLGSFPASVSVVQNSCIIR